MSSQVVDDALQSQTDNSINSSRNAKYRFDIAVLIAATSAITLVMFLFGVMGSGGHLAAPLDDTFIHLQYARQIADGHPFQYNTGDMPSSGDSSFIYPFLLAPAFLFGLEGTRVLLFAFGLGFVAHLVAVILLYKLALLLFSRRVALLSPFFLLLDGRSNWHFLTGMETGVYAGALLAFFYVWARGIRSGRFVLAAVVGVLVALLRPEGHVVVSFVCVLTLFYFWRTKRFSKQSMWLLVPAVAGLLPYVVNIALTGYWQFNTATGKSSFLIPYIPLYQELGLVPIHLIDLIKDALLGLDIPYSPFPLFMTLPLVALGARYALQSQRHALPNMGLLLGLAVGIGFALLFRGAPIDRYFQPYDAFIWLYFAGGLVWVVEQARQVLRRPEANGSGIVSSRTTYAWVVGVIVLFMLPQFVRYFVLLGDSNRDIYYQQMTFSNWLRSNTPPDARIGVNDIGAHKYLGDRHITDLVGLTDDDLRGVFFSGWGSIYDVLMRRPEDRRPQYILIHPNAFINDTDASVGQGFLTPIYSVTVQDIAITAGPTETLYKVNWDKAALDQKATNLLHVGDGYLDSINIGDLLDEQGHNYNMVGKQASVTEPKSILTTSIYADKGLGLTDSGRRHSGSEQFTVTSVPGQPLTFVSRTILNPDADQHLKVLVNGKEVGIWDAHNTRAGLWQEYEYTIPAQFITSERTTLTIDASFDPGGPGFISYRYWVYVP